MPLGGLIPLAVLLPNLLMIFLRPVATPPEAKHKTARMKLMELVERIGQAGCFLIPCFYQLPLLRTASVDALVVMGLALAFYYAGWVRYVAKGHRFTLLFAPMIGVPVPMAVAPVVYFATASFFLQSWPLGVAALLLGIGHISISQGEWERSKNIKILQAS